MRDLAPPQRALARPGEVLGRLPGEHAEITALKAAGEAGLTPQGTATTTNSEDLFRRFVRILPHLCDRWRTRSTPFQVVLYTDRATADNIKALVAQMYAEFRASEWDSDFTEVPICDAGTGCRS